MARTRQVNNGNNNGNNRNNRRDGRNGINNGFDWQLGEVLGTGDSFARGVANRSDFFARRLKGAVNGR